MYAHLAARRLARLVKLSQYLNSVTDLDELLHFILNVTGIPPTEAQAVRSRGEDYRRYQRTTSAFVPWFPREDAS